MTAFFKNAIVVLVHGAWADGSSWSQVVLASAERRSQSGVRADPAYVFIRRYRCLRSGSRAHRRVRYC